MRIATLCMLALTLTGACKSGSSSSSSSAPRTAPVIERLVAAPLERVWRATVSAVHATGVAVPASAEHDATGGRIETRELRVLLEAEDAERTRVFARYRELPPAEADRRARLLLEDIERRATL